MEKLFKSKCKIEFAYPNKCLIQGARQSGKTTIGHHIVDKLNESVEKVTNKSLQTFTINSLDGLMKAVKTAGDSYTLILDEFDYSTLDSDSLKVLNSFIDNAQYVIEIKNSEKDENTAE